MKRYSLKLALVTMAALAPGCGGLGSLLGNDGGTASDMAMAAPADMMWYQLKSGVYTVTAVRSDVAKDGCKVDPNNAMAPLVGRSFAIQNNGMGVIKFSSIDSMTMNTPAADTGTPPQPSNGTACTAANMPAECATEQNVVTVGSAPNRFTMVRDNTVAPDAMCTFKRHIVNLVSLNGPSQFTAAYTRTDSAPMNCTNQVMACTTTFEWDLKYVKDFGQ